MEASVRILPSLTIAEANPSGTKGFVAEMKGKALQAIVEQVRDGSTIRVYLIPSFSFVQVYVAGVQVIIYIPSLLSFNSFLFLVGMANIDWTKITGSIHGKTASKCGCSERSN